MKSELDIKKEIYALNKEKERLYKIIEDDKNGDNSLDHNLFSFSIDIIELKLGLLEWVLN